MNQIKRLFYKLVYRLLLAYWFIFRPKTLGVKCVVEYQGQILMIKDTYEPHHWWTFPGGGIKKDESPEEAIKREVSEEVNIRILRPEYLGELTTREEYKKDTVFCYYSKVDSPEFSLDPGEIAVAKWFSRDSLDPSPFARRILDLLRTHRESERANSLCHQPLNVY